MLGTVLLLLLLLLLGGLAPPRADAEGTGKPMLWVTKNEPRLWVFGTCGLPDARAQALPKAADKALGACGTFVTGLPASSSDVARLEHQVKRLSALSPEAGGLRKVLGEETYDRLYRYVPQITTLESREPWYVQRLLVRAHLDKVYPRRAPLLTRTLWARAAGDGLQTVGLDTMPEYLDAYDALALGDQAAWLRHTLDLYEKDKKTKVTREQSYVESYLAGDIEKVQALWRESLPLGELGKKLATTMLDDRVGRMLGRLASRLRHAPGKPVFLAVNAALLAGKHGVLARLTAAGHELRR
jgi:uncharacterized protein YbaP (TraB family)